MKVDEDVGVDDEGGGEVDGATHARTHVVGEKTPHLVAKGQVFGGEQEIHCTSPRGHSSDVEHSRRQTPSAPSPRFMWL